MRISGACAAAFVRCGIGPDSDARSVKNAAGRLRRALLPHIAGTTTRNTYRDRGPGVSLNRRDGCNPLRRWRFKPVTVWRTTLPLSTPVGVQFLTPAAARCNPCHAMDWLRRNTLAAPAVAGDVVVKVQPFCDAAVCSEHTSIVFNVLGVTRIRDTETPWGLVVPRACKMHAR